MSVIVDEVVYDKADSVSIDVHDNLRLHSENRDNVVAIIAAGVWKVVEVV